MNELNVTLGLILRTHRLQSNYTLADAAEMSQISIQSLSLYEEGQVKIPLADIYCLANLYNIQPTDIIDLIYKFATNSESKDNCKSEVRKSSSK